METTSTLRQYIEQEILPRYRDFGRSHGPEHVARVIANTWDLLQLKNVRADANMAYTVAAYHDVGMVEGRWVHHLSSARILRRDGRLKEWFNAEQIELMAQAVEDHRASNKRAPRSIYGRIVAEADRDLEPQVVFRRAIEFGLEHYSQLDAEDQWLRFREHMHEKYGVGGYLRLWIPGSANESRLRQIREIIDNEKQLHDIFYQIFSQIAKTGGC